MALKHAVHQATVILAVLFLGSDIYLPVARGQAVPAIFGQHTEVDCSDEVNADNQACRTARMETPKVQETAPAIPAGAAQPPSYNDTERVYVDPSPDRFSQNARSQPKPQAVPEPLTEFQKMVAASTRVVLPIFGQSLFRADQPSTFAPANQISVAPDYSVGTGDEVLLRIWGQFTLNARLTVDRAGDVYVPHVGQVHVAGLPFSQVDPVLRLAVGHLFRNFDLNVSMGQLRSVQVFVTGYARHPGSYTVSSLSTLLNAVSLPAGRPATAPCGGLS